MSQDDQPEGIILKEYDNVLLVYCLMVNHDDETFFVRLQQTDHMFLSKLALNYELEVNISEESGTILIYGDSLSGETLDQLKTFLEGKYEVEIVEAGDVEHCIETVQYRIEQMTDHGSILDYGAPSFEKH